MNSANLVYCACVILVTFLYSGNFFETFSFNSLSLDAKGSFFFKKNHRGKKVICAVFA